MPVVNTQSLLQDYLASHNQSLEENLLLQAEKLIDPICDYFDDPDRITVHWQLLGHGLFQPNDTNDQAIHGFIQQDFWTKTQNYVDELKEQWQGPDVPIFLFPSDLTNEQLIEQFNGVSGLSFTDKIFLFINENTSDQQLKALVMHEYSHACRLNKMNKHPSEATLIDTMIMEGIAEVIVREEVGTDYVTKPIRDANLDYNTIQGLWKKWVRPNLTLLRSNPLHHLIMYGGEGIPQATGYIVGYYLVKNLYESNKETFVHLLEMPTERFFEENKILS